MDFSSSEKIMNESIWLSCQEVYKSELHHGLSRVLEACLSDISRLSLLDYVLYWHPRWIRTQPISRYWIPVEELIRLEKTLSGFSRLLDLLGQRGPDFGVSLLLLLEICFQIAYNPSTDIKGNWKLMGVLELHVDSPPLCPAFIEKFIQTTVGYLEYRDMPYMCLARVQHSLLTIDPRLRALCGTKQKAFSMSNVEKIDSLLWKQAARLSLGSVKEEHQKIESFGDTMAYAFERLNHLAKSIFGVSLYLFGSASAGFAAPDSDIDVVMQLGQSCVDSLIKEIHSFKNNGGLDINPFPPASRARMPPSLVKEDWSWLTQRHKSTAATIWAGRKFGWAVHRLLGWNVQCVQSAYVPIVRITACLNSRGMPKQLPEFLRNKQALKTTFADCFELTCSILKESYNLNDPFALSCSRSLGITSATYCNLAEITASNIVSEIQYSSWTPQISLDSESTRQTAYSLLNEEPATETLRHIAILLDSLTSSAERRPPDCDSGFGYGPGLIPPKPEPPLADGKLTLNDDPGVSELWIVQADISMDRLVSLHNSRLLKAYASCDPRVVALGLLVKLWAKRKRIL